MTRSSLLIERLLVRKGGGSVYDEKFHRGLNVIRGDHSVGKTTILELLFYVLGGEIKDNQWLYPADKCDDVFCQVNVNGRSFTLRRPIERGKIPPVLIRSGAYDEEASSEAWGSYGPRRNESDSKMSFSQKLFELLGWDTYKTEDYANLTMHQILRFLYVDQETASTKIFRAEDGPRSDSEGTRVAIAEFLLGLDNLDTHQLRQELLMAEREFERVSADLAAMYRILGDESSVTFSMLQSMMLSNLDEIVRLRDAPPDLIDSQDVEQQRKKASEYRRISGEIDLYNRQIQNYERELVSLEGEIVDCGLFAGSLQQRKKALLESKAAYESLGLIKYSHCPCCMGAIADATLGGHDTCHLCKSPIEKERRVSNYMEILNELDFQLSSNSRVLSDYVDHKQGVESALSVARMSLQNAQSLLAEVAKVVDWSSHAALERAKKIGFLEAENSGLERKIKIITELDNQKTRKLDLNADIMRLRELIAAASAGNARRRSAVYTGLSENVISIIHSDKRVNGKPYEEDFADASVSDVEIDFARDRMLINGRVKFSGSSNFVKKNSLNISALLESLDDESFRLPRFLMIDAIENGGMKEFRSHNFQRTLIECFKGRDDFQLIFCTSMVLDELDNEVFGVGPYYSDNVLKI